MKLNLKLRERILIPVLVLIISGMGFTIFTSNSKSRSALTKNLEKSMTEIVSNINKNLYSWVEQNKAIIEIISHIEKIQKGVLEGESDSADRKAASEKLRELNNNYKNFEGFFLADKTGEVLVSSFTDANNRYNISDRPYFKKAITGEANISKVIINKHTQNKIFTISAPLYNAGEICGVITGSVKINYFIDKFISNVKIGTTGYAYIINSKGVVIAHPDKSLILKADFSKYDFGKKILLSRKGIIEYDWKGEKSLAIFEKSSTTDWYIALKVLPKEIFAPVTDLQKTNISIASITILILIAAIIFITSTMVLKPVVLAANFAEQIAAGDLNAEVKLKRSDEIGQLLNSLNSMGSKLKEMFEISTLRKLVDELTGDSAKLNKISAKMNFEIEDSAGKSSGVAKESLEMTGNIAGVAKALEESAEYIASVATGTEQMSSTISEIAENTEKASSITKNAVNKTNKASQRINHLGEAATEINAVTDTISDISEQTNLLALNATIEAARAGDAGKGFAVVASEIKDLANQTAEATKNISSQIKNIQSSTEITVSDINEIAGTINQVDILVSSVAAAIEEQTATTREISESINQVSLNINEVNKTMTGNSNSADQINGNIVEIHSSMKKLKNESISINKSSEDLEQLAFQVRNLVDRFKI